MFWLLGVMARFGERCSRLRGQGIPPTLVLIALCLFLFLYGLGNYLEALANSGEPDKISQLQLLEGAPAHKDWVEIRGTFVQPGPLPGEDKTVYAPLFESASKTVTYVRVPGSMSLPTAGQEVAVRGMLQFVGKTLENQLPPDGQGIRLNRNQYLYYGTRPAHPLLALALMAVSAPTGLLLAVVSALKYIVFRVHSQAQETPCSGPIQSMGITACLSGESGQPKRFLDTPGQLQEGTLTATVGQEVFSLEMDRTSLKKLQAGTLYLGFQQRPALRFCCLDKHQGKRQQIVLSFDNESQRRFIWEELTTCAEIP